MGNKTITPEVKVGTELYQDGGNGIIYAHVVYKVGTKYFYTNHNGRFSQYNFKKDSLRYDEKGYTGRAMQLYRTEQEIKDKYRFETLYTVCKRHFSHSLKNTFTLEQLEEIVEILKLF